MPRRSHIGTVALLGAVGSWACHDSTAPPGRLVALSATSRGVSLREDSLRVVTDSAAVSLGGARAASTGWVATHGGGTWLTLTTASGTGSGVVRWTRNVPALTAGTYVDTITVALQGTAAATALLVDSVTVRDAPAQYIAARRAWRIGERDSLAAYIVRTRAMDDFSDVAAQALLREDSAVDIILNPAWHAAAGMGAAGVLPAPRIANGWNGRGLDILVVFDSVPGGTIQRDSLDWISLRWWNPADSTWKGWMIRGTNVATWGTYVTVNTTAFDATGEHSGVGGGEARLASGTYWEANGGGYRTTYNAGYGTFSQLTSGPYLGGDYAVGRMGGRLNNITMPRLLGGDAPATQTFSVDFETSYLSAWRIICYFPPIPPVSPYHACTGEAAARLVAAARAGRVTPALLAGVADPLFDAMTPRARPRPRPRRRRRV